ncbi:MAG: hypothetical protein NTW67_02540 [Candidatus Woesearchaeota archaeon]|nr:hypothetical protein [Candidatus Woesearchaeota archaeon]
MKCPKCDKEVIGELQSFCRHCNYTFDSGGDRWFNNEDESIPLSEF